MPPPPLPPRRTSKAEKKNSDAPPPPTSKSAPTHQVPVPFLLHKELQSGHASRHCRESEHVEHEDAGRRRRDAARKMVVGQSRHRRRNRSLPLCFLFELVSSDTTDGRMTPLSLLRARGEGEKSTRGREKREKNGCEVSSPLLFSC